MMMMMAPSLFLSNNPEWNHEEMSQRMVEYLIGIVGGEGGAGA
jgi:hypothetical protein